MWNKWTSSFANRTRPKQRHSPGRSLLARRRQILETDSRVTPAQCLHTELNHHSDHEPNPPCGLYGYGALPVGCIGFFLAMQSTTPILPD
jgi:hypothetical protein